MKIRVPSNGRVIHGVGKQAGNPYVVEDYEAVCGPAALPAIYASFESFPGRGIDTLKMHLGAALAEARNAGVGLSIGLVFEDEHGTASDALVAVGALDPELQELGAFLATYNDVPMLIRPGTELNTGTFGYGPDINDAYAHMVEALEGEGVDASWCWAIEPHGGAFEFPDRFETLVDWFGISFFAASAFTEEGGAKNKVDQLIGLARKYGKPIAVPEATPALATSLPFFSEEDTMIEAGQAVRDGWMLAYGRFLAHREVKLSVLLPVDWTAAPTTGGPGWGDCRLHLNPVTAAALATWWREPGGFIHRAEFNAMNARQAPCSP